MLDTHGHIEELYKQIEDLKVRVQYCEAAHKNDSPPAPDQSGSDFLDDQDSGDN
jgi:hypothetical protein